MKSTLRLCLVVLFVSSWLTHAAAANLVTNNSFEQGALGLGSFQGWQTDLGDPATFVDSSGQTGPHFGQASDGLWSAYFGSTFENGGASISQTLVTTIGDTYSLTFDLANDNAGQAAANNFVASIGGSPVLSFTDLPAQDYIPEQYIFTAASNTTALTFFGYNEQSYLQLDNVVVSLTPEPSAAPLLFTGILVVGLISRVRLFKVALYMPRRLVTGASLLFRLPPVDALHR